MAISRGATSLFGCCERSTLRSARFVLRLFGSAAIFVAPLSGCTYGFIYTDVTEPLSEDMHDTSFSPKGVVGDRMEIKEPFTFAGVRVLWASNGIGDIAKTRGLDKLQYADVRTISVLGGIWRKRTVIVYGE